MRQFDITQLSDRELRLLSASLEQLHWSMLMFTAENPRNGGVHTRFFLPDWFENLLPVYEEVHSEIKRRKDEGVDAAREAGEWTGMVE
jgi:hypothetical protein